MAFFVADEAVTWTKLSGRNGEEGMWRINLSIKEDVGQQSTNLSLVAPQAHHH